MINHSAISFTFENSETDTSCVISILSITYKVTGFINKQNNFSYILERHFRNQLSLLIHQLQVCIMQFDRKLI